MIGVEDYNAWLKISRVSNGFKLIKKDLGFYRLHENNISSSIPFSPPLSAIEDFLIFLSPREKEKLYANYHYAEIRSLYLKNSNIFKSLELLKNFKKVKGLNRVKIVFMFVVLIFKNQK
jgi:hypothetical protein